MHKTSFMKAQAFFDTYVKPYRERVGGRTKILDVGSRAYEGQRSYADIFNSDGIDYVGLDLERGENVHIVPENAFYWREIDSESVDFCVSGQTFEHNPFFWITFAEIARILRQGGMAFIVAPGRGAVHRYPVDCWRFYPDAWQSLCSYTGLELVEGMFEDYQFSRVEHGAEWCDSCVVASKPSFEDEGTAARFYGQLARIVATIPSNFENALIPNDRPLAAFSGYQKSIECSVFKALKRRVRRKRLFRSVFERY